MVRRQVEERRRVEAQGVGEIELEGRKLEDVNRIALEGGKRQDGLADIAADINVSARLFQDMADQRCRGRLAVRTGDADDGWPRPRLKGVEGAREELRVADHRNLFHARLADDRMGFRMSQRHAGRNDNRLKLAPWPVFRMLAAIFRVGDLVARLTVLVERKHLRAGRGQRLAGRNAAQPEAENADFLPLDVRDQDHRRP